MAATIRAGSGKETVRTAFCPALDKKDFRNDFSATESES
jgi:hypothetical protein